MSKRVSGDVIESARGLLFPVELVYADGRTELVSCPQRWLRQNFYRAYRAMHTRGYGGCWTWKELFVLKANEVKADVRGWMSE